MPLFDWVACFPGIELYELLVLFSSVQFIHSVVSDSLDPMNCSMPGFPVHHQLPELAQTLVHRLSVAVQPSHPLSSPSPLAFNLGPISFRIDWLDLLAVQGTLKSLLQHHSSKASILQCSAFFVVQLSHPFMTTGKTIPLTMQTFVSKVMSLLLNMLCLS